ncbi:DUF2778 domain-containing protein [Vibrio parahaemolyticus]|uniref:tlde1 domain-containing protein n=1 Tax=Vibrio TaxID=662 RepID=UPI000A204D38|nr:MULTISPECIES: tlde1 domain-containing protein [Vibrio]ARN66134.1 hypothetical protein FORC36_1617 [Vibrio vulnificus]EID4426083.1 DUF2778 domain-containing protein [Vibrio vulnificus]MBE3723392.1 DUF2778 domain-containing protein [Vibrio parahaemolyticus]TOC25185.1 DUF2778 domain-containing protein [Vibrio parahaemolyticus]HCG6123230.1 DUF2778 domain-containing protein [Vibrio parahaemolyticus]
MKIVFSISRGKLNLVTPCLSLSIKATSGRGNCLNNASLTCQMKSFEGPLPVGSYYINPSEVSDPNMLGDMIRRTKGDWGDWRVRLHPVAGSKTHGRDNFFLHGGGLPGSAGCIDIGGGVIGNEITDKILSYITSSKVSIAVEVIE